ncbi:unnamed protein product, partial [Anisakis simplex]|uniref:Uncharacterized protein n=1 Tax=Anisakis simplex TaxID=6269 RepID=A0A0M3J7A0_ANISI
MNALRCNKNNGEGHASTSTTTNLFNFDSVNDLIEMGDMDEKFLLFVALLAERMGFYKHSFKYIQLYCKCGNNGDTLNNIHYQRIAIRSKSAEINNCVEQLKAFVKLCALEKTQLYDELVRYSKLYSELFDILNENALERMRAFLAQNDSRLSTVLIVSMLICFEK